MQIRHKFLWFSSLLITTIVPLSVISCTGFSMPGVYLALDGPDHTEQDKSFNQQVFEGIKSYLKNNPNNSYDQTEAYVAKPGGMEDRDFQQMYANIPKDSIILAPGFVHQSPLQNSLEELSDKKIVFLDGEIMGKDNVASIVYQVEQAAYLGGYALMQYAATEEGFNDLKHANTAGDPEKVLISTYGGTDIPSVTGFMGGFQYGILDAKKAISDDAALQSEYPHYQNVDFFTFNSRAAHYSGGYASGQGVTVSNNLKNAKVDVIMPVAGPQTQYTLNAFNGKVIGVDSPQELFYLKDQSRFLFSVLKDMNLTSEMMIKKMQGDPSVGDLYKGLGETTYGSVDNGLVGISHHTDALTTLYEAARNDENIKIRAKAINNMWFLDYQENWFENL